MVKFNNKKWFVGIDISKDSIDVAVTNHQNQNSFIDKKLKNDSKGFELLLRWLEKNKIEKKEALFCMEHTGNYGLLLFVFLNQNQIDFCVEPGLQIKRSIGMTRGKNDKVDARRIATYAYVNRAKLKQFVVPSKKLLQIKQLLTYREQLVKTRSGFKNSIVGHGLYEKAHQYDFVTDDIKQQVEQLTQRILNVEAQVEGIINSEQNLKNNLKFATSVIGIGLIIGAFMLVTTNNFTSFDNGRKYACYTGIAPFEHTSGSSVHGKTSVSHLANKRMKALLSNGANSAKNADPELKNYYNRKIKEGKEHKSVINAISCKLVYRVFAVIKRQSPYVSIYQQNF